MSLLGREWQYRVYFHHTGYPAAFKVFYILFLSQLKTISTSIKCSAHGQVERTTVDSCVAASRQRPNSYHVEGTDTLDSVLLFIIMISLNWSSPFLIMWEVNCWSKWSVWSLSPLILRWFSGCLQQHEWQCIQAKQYDQTPCIPWRWGLHSSPWLWSIIFHTGARGDTEECDFSNTSSEACSQEVDRLFRRRKTKLSESIWLFRESP